MKRHTSMTDAGPNNRQDRRHYQYHVGTLPAKRKSRRNTKSLAACFSVLFVLLLAYIYTIFSAIQMQATDTDVDAGNARLKTKQKKTLSRNATITEKTNLVLNESFLDIALSIAPPSSQSLSLVEHGKNLDYTAAIRSLQALTKSPPLGSIVCPSPHYTPIYDKIVGANSNDTNKTTHSFTRERKIPRIIHVSFNSRCVPNELAESITLWQDALPDHAIFFHDDEAVQRLIGVDNHKTQLWHFSDDFPGLRNSLRCVKFKGAMLIDVWRMLVVWTYGGIYTDIDNWPGPKFNAHTTIRDEDSFFSLSDGKERPSQWLFGMTPKHPIAIFTLQDISRRLLKVKNIARPRVVHTTGPQTLKYAFQKFNLLLKGNATIFGNSSYFTQIRKIDLADSDQYAKGNLGNTFDEIVDYYFDQISNTTYSNITKRKKTELLSGVKHWTEDVKLGEKKENATIDDSNKNTEAGAQKVAYKTTNKTNDEEKRAIPYDGLSCIEYLATID